MINYTIRIEYDKDEIKNNVEKLDPTLMVVQREG